MISVRQCRPNDFDKVSELAHGHMSLEEWQAYVLTNPKAVSKTERQIKGEDGICFIAEVDNDLAGYVIGGVKDTPLTSIKYTELEAIMVKSKYRNQGIGSLLAKQFLSWSHKIGADRMSTLASPKNEIAIKFYKQLGFSPSSLELEMKLKRSTKTPPNPPRQFLI